jgi:hypothetical protein
VAPRENATGSSWGQPACPKYWGGKLLTFRVEQKLLVVPCAARKRSHLFSGHRLPEVSPEYLRPTKARYPFLLPFLTCHAVTDVRNTAKSVHHCVYFMANLILLGSGINVAQNGQGEIKPKIWASFLTTRLKKPNSSRGEDGMPRVIFVSCHQADGQ